MREKKINSGKKRIICCVAGCAALLCCAALVLYSRSKEKFAAGTVINGMDVSGMTAEEVKKDMQEYSLTVIYRDEAGEDVKEELRGTDFDFTSGKNAEEVTQILENQGMWKYLTGQGKEHKIDNWVEYDKEKLLTAVGELECFDSSRFVEPQDAYISDYSEENGYQIVPETKGTMLDQEKAGERIIAAVDSMKSEVELSDEDCYQTAEITADDANLNATLEKLNTYAGAKITYQFGSKEEILDGTTISKWLKVNKKGNVVIQKKKLSAYVASLRKKYDSIFRSRRFKTSYGKTITITGGDYGWWMNYAKEEKELLKLIKAGTQTERTPEYYQTADRYGKKDYGNSYVEINLTTQHVFLYINGKKIVETDCVTGNSSRGYDTPVGTYSITYTQKDATLVGENYSTPVKYWMPFNRNIGLHDANWRSSFGGEIYKYNGSHGCVNLPPASAAKIFKYVKKGMPVFCYQLEVKKKTTDTSSQQTVEKKKSAAADNTKKNSTSSNSKKKAAAKKNSKKKNKKG